MVLTTSSAQDAAYQAYLWHQSLQEGLEFLRQQHPLDFTPLSLVNEQVLVNGYLREYRQHRTTVPPR